MATAIPARQLQAPLAADDIIQHIIIGQCYYQNDVLPADTDWLTDWRTQLAGYYRVCSGDSRRRATHPVQLGADARRGNASDIRIYTRGEVTDGPDSSDE